MFFQLFADEALTIWNKMKDLNETKVDAYHMTHDGTPAANEGNAFKGILFKYWRECCRSGQRNFSSSGYLKLWQLQVPKPCLSQQYDVLFIDEAQDCTPGSAAVTQSQERGEKSLI